MTQRDVAVIYLARAGDENARGRFERFSASYVRYPAGLSHQLIVIIKGFASTANALQMLGPLKNLADLTIPLADDDFDLGAYREAALRLEHKTVCFLNSASEITSTDWLAKLINNLEAQNGGLVSASGSYESLDLLDARFPSFPNVHIRTNAFALERSLFLELVPGRFPDKRAAHLFESGRSSLTRKMLARGLKLTVVGRDGRGYPPQHWPQSETFRLGDQSNLLVHDNVTRAYEASTWDDKRTQVYLTWGAYINRRVGLLLPAARFPD